MRAHRLMVHVAIALAVWLVPAPAQAADDYPNRPVRLIVGFAVGSAADIIARIIGPKLADRLGQNFVIENRTGAGSSVAAEHTTRAPNDGYTLFMGGVANAVQTTFLPKLSFNFEKDLAPIALVAELPQILVVHPSVGAGSVKELIAVGKTKPLFFGSSGVGTVGNLSAAMFKAQTQTDVVMVTYKGSSLVMTDLLAGRLSGMFAVASTMLPHVGSGRLKMLAVSLKRRMALLPDIPTMSEAGVQGFEASLWFGLMAPAGTPQPIIDRLARATNEVLMMDDVTATLRKQGIGVLGGSPDEFARHIRSETDKWAQALKGLNLKKN